MGSSQALASATDECRAELAAVRGSELFSRTPALANLLTYLCEKTLAGEANQIKEYTIAVEVFGRAVDYDQEADSIVRVEAARLRKRLKQFYEGPGADHRMRIAIPVGQYVPVFRENEAVEAPDVVGSAIPPIHPETDEFPAEAADKAVESAPAKVSRRGRHWVLIGVGGVAALCIVALLLVLVFRAPRAEVATARSSEVPKPPADVVNGIPAGDELRILCGSDRQYIDRTGKTWLADRYFSGGSPVRASVAHIWRTPDPEIYKSSRQGDFTYDIPLAPGIYELHLHFAEINYGPEEQAGGGEGSRILGVSANGQPLIASLDVVADSGAARTADVKIFTDVRPADDGMLHLKFWSLHGGRGMVTAIEVLPGRKGRIRPIRITTRESAYYSNDSRWWSPDIYYKGGQLAKYSDPVTGADDPELYESERWGNFSYAIPVPPGKYALTLSFVERCGPTARDGCVGTEAANPERERSFNVACNGKPLLREFNILKEAGGLKKVVEKRFAGLEPNAQGKLLVDFVPSKGYARVTGIEVLPE